MKRMTGMAVAGEVMTRIRMMDYPGNAVEGIVMAGDRLTVAWVGMMMIVMLEAAMPAEVMSEDMKMNSGLTAMAMILKMADP